MADVYLYNSLFSTQINTSFVGGSITVGSDGYVASGSSVPREIRLLQVVGGSNTGHYELFLSSNWNTLMDVHIATVRASGVGTVQLISHNIGASVSTGQQFVEFQILDGSGTAQALSAGDQIVCMFTLKNSSG